MNEHQRALMSAITSIMPMVERSPENVIWLHTLAQWIVDLTATNETEWQYHYRTFVRKIPFYLHAFLPPEVLSLGLDRAPIPTARPPIQARRPQLWPADISVS
jgi:hypothetical protein